MRDLMQPGAEAAKYFEEGYQRKHKHTNHLGRARPQNNIVFKSI
jgi:hypothetical protein